MRQRLSQPDPGLDSVGIAQPATAQRRPLLPRHPVVWLVASAAPAAVPVPAPVPVVAKSAANPAARMAAVPAVSWLLVTAPAKTEFPGIEPGEDAAIRVAVALAAWFSGQAARRYWAVVLNVPVVLNVQVSLPEPPLAPHLVLP